MDYKRLNELGKREALSREKRGCYTVIPATPGWLMVSLTSDTGEVITDPVIAWGIERELDDGGEVWFHTPIPITTTEGAESNNANDYAVLSPEGYWSIPYQSSGGDGMPACVEALRELQREYAAMKKKPAGR